MEGYICLHRKILDSPVFDNPALLKMWIWMLTKASFRRRTELIGLTKVELEEGQFIFGRRAAAAALGIKEATCYRHLKWLEGEGMIHVHSGNQFSVITIVNWGRYQTSEDGRRATDEQPMNTNKKDKHSNKYSEQFEQIWALYPHKVGKGKISPAKQKLLCQISLEEWGRIIRRYEQGLARDEWRKPQNGGTFFHSGYVDYTDANYTPPAVTAMWEGIPRI